MSENFGIVVEIDPARALQGLGAVDARLQKTEQQGKRTGDAVSRALAGADNGAIARASAAAGVLGASLNRVSTSAQAARGSSAALGAALTRTAGAATDVRASASSAGNAIEDIGDRADKASSKLDGLGLTAKRALQGLGVGLLVREAVTLSDAYTTLGNRVAVVTKTQEEAAAVSARLFAISQESRTGLEATTQVYSRVAATASEMGRSQEDVLQFTELLNKAVKVSGASANEAENAMVQLSQGLGAGALRGEELNSVLEQLPYVADVIAKGMGITRGELRKFGEEGKLASKEVFDAFKKGSSEIEAAYGKTIPTVRDGITLVRNAAIQFFGELGQSSGVSKAAGAALKFIAENFETISRVALAAGSVLAGHFARRGISAAIAGIRQLTIAAAANPFGAMLLAISGAVAMIVQFRDRIKLVEGSAATLGDFFEAMGTQIRTALSAALDAVKGLIASVAGFFGEMVDAAQLSVADVLVFFGAMVDGVGKLLFFMKDTIVVTFGGIPVAIAETFIDIFNGLLKIVDGFLIKAKKAIDAIREYSDPTKLARAISGSGPSELTGSKLDPRDAEFLKGRGQTIVSPVGVPLDKLVTLPSGRQEALGKAPESSESILGRIDNPFDGARSAVVKGYKEAWQNLTNGEAGAVQSAIEGAINDATRKTRKPERSVDLTAKGPGAQKGPSDDEIKALEKLTSAYEKLEGAAFPVVAAQRELSDTEGLLSKAVAAGIVDQERANQILARKRELLASQLDPAGAAIDALEEEIRLLRIGSAERGIEAEALRFEAEMRAKTGTVAAEQIAEYRRLLGVKEELTAADKAREAQQQREAELIELVRGKTNQYAADVALLDGLLAAGTITADEYASAINKLQGHLDTAPIDQYTAAIKDLSNELNTTLSQGFNSALDGLYELATGGKASFADLARSIAKDISLIIAKMLLLEGIKAAFGASGGGVGGFLTGLVTGSFQGNNAAGGQFIVPGSGKTDSQTVSFRATPGERVTITRPEQSMRNFAAGGMFIVEQKRPEAFLAAQRNFAAGGSFLVGQPRPEAAIAAQRNFAAGGSFLVSQGRDGAPVKHTTTINNFASGGSFTVAGTGRTDSVPVAFRATPGERVTVSRPESGGQAGSPNVNVPVKVVVVSDQQEAMREQMRSADGERVILEHIARNASKIRAALAR